MCIIIFKRYFATLINIDLISEQLINKILNENSSEKQKIHLIIQLNSALKR